MVETAWELLSKLIGGKLNTVILVAGFVVLGVSMGLLIARSARKQGHAEGQVSKIDRAEELEERGDEVLKEGVADEDAWLRRSLRIARSKFRHHLGL